MFNEDDYKGEWLLIRRLLRTMTVEASWTKEEAQTIQKKAYTYFLLLKKGRVKCDERGSNVIVMLLCMCRGHKCNCELIRM